MNNDIKKATNPIKTAKDGIYGALDIKALGLHNDNLYYRDINHESVGFKTGAVETTIDFFCKVFELDDCKRKQFDTKFRESISGNGNELTKNDALHSSSLCALLCFFNVSSSNPLEYDGIEYTDVFFEVKNKVFGTPSNMDVVLTGKDANEKNAILFIECKFSEFIGRGSEKLSSKYSDGEYGSIFNEFEYSKCKVFQSGLKQLVAHYIGITNFSNRNKDYREDMLRYYEDNDLRANLYKTDFENVSFIEVLFKLEDVEDFKTYKDEAEKVFEALKSFQNKHQNDIKPKIKLNGTTTYQELFNGKNNRILPPKVKDFYRL